MFALKNHCPEVGYGVFKIIGVRGRSKSSAKNVDHYLCFDHDNYKMVELQIGTVEHGFVLSTGGTFS